MDFFKGFLRGIALVPGVIQDTETLFGAQVAAQAAAPTVAATAAQTSAPSGQQKKAAAIEIVGAAISMADAISTQQIADPDKFTAGLGEIIDGVVACLNASIWAKR